MAMLSEFIEDLLTSIRLDIMLGLIVTVIVIMIVMNFLQVASTGGGCNGKINDLSLYIRLFLKSKPRFKTYSPRSCFKLCNLKLGSNATRFLFFLLLVLNPRISDDHFGRGKR